VILIQTLDGVKRRWRQAEGKGGAAGRVTQYWGLLAGDAERNRRGWVQSV